jgi:hypothetical protein
MFCLFFIQFSFVGSGKWATHGVALNRLGNTTSIVTELTRQVSESACDKVWVHEAAIPQLLMIWPKNVCSCGQILKQKWGWKMGKKFNVLERRYVSYHLLISPSWFLSLSLKIYIALFFI